MVMETEQRRGAERTPRDGEREEPQPELAGTGGSEGLQPPVWGSGRRGGKRRRA